MGTAQRYDDPLAVLNALGTVIGHGMLRPSDQECMCGLHAVARGG